MTTALNSSSCSSASDSSQEQQQRRASHICLVDADTDDLFYRPIKASDRDFVKQLHEEWFPVTYQDEFYDDLSRGQLAGTPLFTRLAITRKTKKNRKTQTQQNVAVQQWLDTLHHRHQQQKPYEPFDDDNDDNNNSRGPFSELGRLFADTFEMDEEIGLGGDRGGDLGKQGQDDDEVTRVCIEPIEYTPLPPPTLEEETDNDLILPTHSNQHISVTTSPSDRVEKEEQEEVVAGCVVGSFMHVTRLPKPLQDVLVSDPLRHNKLFYIMTLGTVSEFRGAGLGTRLVQQCMDEVENEPSCGALYLHVITHNTAAIQLYERLGFYRVQEIADYYDIDGRKYPCYLYAKYYHGNSGHLDLYKWIASCVWSFFRHVLQLTYSSGLLLHHHDSTTNNNSNHDDNDGVGL